MGDGGWHLPSKTLCPVCGQPIRRTKHDSYSQSAWLNYQPAHLQCAASVQPREMAATGGDE